MNNITLLGRLTANVDLKESHETKYTQFSIAVNRARNNGVDFINCVAFNKLAEALARNCQKGRQLLVNGRLQSSRSKGTTYYSVVSNQITFLQRPRSEQGRTSVQAAKQDMKQGDLHQSKAQKPRYPHDEKPAKGTVSQGQMPF